MTHCYDTVPANLSQYKRLTNLYDDVFVLNCFCDIVVVVIGLGLGQVDNSVNDEKLKNIKYLQSLVRLG